MLYTCRDRTRCGGSARGAVPSGGRKRSRPRALGGFRLAALIPRRRRGGRCVKQPVTHLLRRRWRACGAGQGRFASRGTCSPIIVHPCRTTRAFATVCLCAYTFHINSASARRFAVSAITSPVDGLRTKHAYTSRKSAH